MPALAADEPGYTPDGQYWNGAVWAPTNYMVVKGLQDYGFEDDAEKNLGQVPRQYVAGSLKDTRHDMGELRARICRRLRRQRYGGLERHRADLAPH